MLSGISEGEQWSVHQFKGGVMDDYIRQHVGCTAMVRIGLAACWFVSACYAQPDRIHSPINAGDTVALSGHLSPRLQVAVDRGSVPADLWIGHITLVLNRTPAQQAALDALLEQQRSPSSPQYRRWLGPEEFANQFGVSSNDIAKITQWIESQGLTIERVARSRSSITFGGAAARISQAFGTPLHYVDVASEQRFVNTTEPRLPTAVREIALAVLGLSNFRAKPTAQSSPVFPILPTASCPEAGRIDPTGLSNIYDIKQPAVTGASPGIAVIGRADPNTTTLLQDVQNFGAQYSISAAAPQLVQANSAPASTNDADLREADLDLEWINAVAPKSQLYYVYADDPFDAARYAIENPIGKPEVAILSMAYGTCELDAAAADPLALRALAQQANAEGITWVAASGNAGPAACDVPGVSPVAANGPAVMLPASIPEVTAIGGTEFAEASAGGVGNNGCFWNTGLLGSIGSAKQYITEQAWNDWPYTNVLWAGGGGASKIYTKPAWQTGLTADSFRDVPDLAFAASPLHDPFVIFHNGQLDVGGGTGAAASIFAGILALLNPSPTGLGNINPELYGLAQANPAVFHDIVMGNNIVPCSGTGCPTAKTLGVSAVAGYDEATGLGSLDVGAFISAWIAANAASTNAASPRATSVILTTDIGTSFTTADSVTLTASVIPPPSSAKVPTGAVNFIAWPPPNAQALCSPASSAQPAGSPIFLGSAPLSTPDGVTADAHLVVTSGQLPFGADTIEAIYTGDASFTGFYSNQICVTVGDAGHSAVVLNIASPTVTYGGVWTAQITLQNDGAVNTILTGFSVGTPTATSTSTQNLSSSIQQIFGSNMISAGKPISGVYRSTGVTITAPELVTFSFAGMDPDTLRPWSAQQTVVFNGPQPIPVTILNGASLGTVTAPVSAPLNGPNAPPDVQNESQNIYAPGMIAVLSAPAGTLTPFSATAGIPWPSTLVSPDGKTAISATVGTSPTTTYNAPIFAVCQANSFPSSCSSNSSDQIYLQIPYELNGFSATATSFPAVLTLNIGGAQTYYSLETQPAAPGIFTTGGIWNASSATQLPVSQNSQQNPAPAGSTVLVYFTGAGAFNTSIATLADGAAATSAVSPLSKIAVSVNGSNVALPANPNLALTPGLVGVAQLAFTLPNNLGTGVYDLYILLSGVTGTGSTAVTLQPVSSNHVQIYVTACSGSCSN